MHSLTLAHYMTSRRVTSLLGHLGDMEDFGSSKAKCSDDDSACKSCEGESNPAISPLQRNPTSASPAAAVITQFRQPRIRNQSDYVQSLRNRHLQVYYLGELVVEPADHPAIKPSINAVGMTYEIPEAQAKSQLSGFAISRFLHITTSVEDVVLQSRMQRRLGQLTGTCFQRCVGMDALNALYKITYECDAKHQTKYHANLLAFIRLAHSENSVVGGAMTDGKGDRSKRPSDQPDLDVHLRVVERRVDGVVVRGVKTHQTGCVNSHHLIVMPGGAMIPKERDFAIAFHIPVTAKGITYVIGRQSCDLRAMEPEADIDLGNAQFGGQEAVVVFDNVFVPYENLVLDGQTDMCGPLVQAFTAYHRRSYICKAGLGDVLVGAAGSISVLNGTDKASHVKDKLIEMAHLNETIASCAVAASYASTQTAAGNFLPNVLMANVCKQNVTRFPYEIARLAQDLAGGLLVTLPSSKDFDNPLTGPMLRKYLAGPNPADMDKRRRVLRLIENMTLGRNAVGYLTESMHGAGSPQAQRVLIAQLHGLEDKIKLANALAGIKE